MFRPRPAADLRLLTSDLRLPTSATWGIKPLAAGVHFQYVPRVHRRVRWLLILWLLLAGFLHPSRMFAQIDPSPRKLVQIGYNAPFEGHPPISAYAFYYWNQPDFPQTNVTLRIAIAPTYLDSELGIRHLLGDMESFFVGKDKLG